MILTIDMGNTNIKIGVARTEKDIVAERVSTAYEKTSLEYATDIKNVLSFHNINTEDIEGAIISSVVPPLTAVMETAIRKFLRMEPIIVSKDLRLDLKFDHFANPSVIGSDLIVGAQAAWTRYRAPVIIVNMGTATTIMLVDKEAQFRGGVILPGMNISLNSLSSKTAQLPDIGLERPGSTMATVTSDCMRAGIVYGNAGQIDGIVQRMEEEIGEECSVVACGGMAKFVVQYCRHNIERDDLLLMKGLLEIYEKNTKN